MSLTSGRLLGLLIGLCVVVLTIVVLARRVSPRHPVATRVIASVILLMLGTAAAGAGVNRHFRLYRGWADLFGVHSKYLVDGAGAGAGAGPGAGAVAAGRGAPVTRHVVAA